MSIKLELHKPESEKPEPRSLSTFVPTPTAGLILQRVSWVHMLGGLGLIRGSAGLGKTTALRHYAAQHQHVHMCKLNEFVRSENDVLSVLQAQLGDAWSGGTGLRGHRRVEFILERLRDLRCQAPFDIDDEDEGQRVRRALLILDEAQHLSPRAISFMRSLTDEDQERLVAVVFAGNRNTVNPAARSPSAARVWLESEWAQVSSRMLRLDLDDEGGISREDVKAYLTAAGIGHDQHDLLGFLWTHAKQPGALRNVRKILEVALMLAGDEPVTVELLTRAVAALGRPSGRPE